VSLDPNLSESSSSCALGSLGPRKLSKILVLAFRRWVELQALPPTPDNIPSSISLEMWEPDSSRALPAISNGACSPDSLPTPTATPVDSESENLSPIRHSPAQEATHPPDAETEPPAFLIVDDNYINLKILSSYMKKLGRVYDTVTDGKEAVELYRRQPGRYKCIFMDISMPVMDGFEATRRIRACETEQQLQPAIIFALSGLASASAQQEAFASGIDLFLTKPVKLKELGTILRSRGLL
jgi:CheY-like chemotaxis protein